MEKENKLLFSSLFLKYQADFEKNPKSRVFAPLAEIYRKVGMTEKSMEILSQGLRFHPTYLMGYLGLSFCYYDLKQYSLAYTTLRPFVEENRDNIRLQKLYSKICIAMAKKDEALETLKYLLFINPRDREIANDVQELERELEKLSENIHRPILLVDNSPVDIEDDISSFQIEKLISVPKNDYDDWVSVNLGAAEKEEPVLVEQLNEEPEEIILKAKPELKIIEQDNSPVVTHTLVDLYCGQGHLEKALEVLEKILILNPNDKRTIEKKFEIQKLISPKEERSTIVEEQVHTKTEEAGRKQLMDLIDEHVNIDEKIIPPQKNLVGLEKKYKMFLKKIHKRALDYQARI